MDNEKLVRDTFAAFEAGDTAKAGSYLADDFTFSGPVPQPIHKAEFLKLQGALVKAIPNWKFNPSNMKTQGNKVMTAVQITGTHTGSLTPVMPGMSAAPATGKKVSLPQEQVTFTVKNDKLASFEVTPIEGGGLPGILTQIGVPVPH
jgi:predicted ester cyclase